MPLDYHAFQHLNNGVQPAQYYVLLFGKQYLNTIVLEHIALDYLVFQPLNNSVQPFQYRFFLFYK